MRIVTPDVPDAEVVRRILDGDREAGSWLVLRHGPVLRAALRRRLASAGGFGPEDVENAMQQAWLRVFEEGSRRLRAYDPGRPLVPFLVAVALNACRDYLKVERRKRRAPPYVLAAGPEPAPEDALEGEEARQAVRDALEGMDRDERMILEWVDQQELTQAEAAALLDLPFRKAGTLLERARKNLRKRLESRPRT